MKRLFALVVLSVGVLAAPRPAAAEAIFALRTANQIFSFDSATPGSITSPLTVTGLLPGTTLVGIDFRPAGAGQLVGVGQTGASGAVYTINTATGAATQINTIAALTGASVWRRFQSRSRCAPDRQ